MSFPYADRPMWLYSRSSDKHLKVLFQQMQNLLDEAIAESTLSQALRRIWVPARAWPEWA